MFRRGLALCLSLAFVSTTMADARITLVATTPTAIPNTYPASSMVSVDIRLSQEPNEAPAAARLLRMAQLDLSDTHASLGVASGPTWNLGGMAGCAGMGNNNCPGYYFDNDLTPTTFGDKTSSMAYYFQNENNLQDNPMAQISVPASGPVTIGTLQVMMPAMPGSYPLNVLDTDEPDANQGSVIYWGFGVNAGDPVRIFRFANASPNKLVGDPINLMVPGTDIHLMSSNPASCTATTTNGTGSSLWRAGTNTILLTFDGPIPALPGAGELEINELTAPGVIGANLNTGTNFTLTIEGGNTLRIRENGTAAVPILKHRSWYVVREIGGWAGVAEFAVKVVVQIGDVNNDGRVLAFDVGLINACIPCANVPCAPPCDERRDIDNNDRILAFDVGLVNPRIPSANVTIPMGHTCP